MVNRVRFSKPRWITATIFGIELIQEIRVNDLLVHDGFVLGCSPAEFQDPLSHGFQVILHVLDGEGVLQGFCRCAAVLELALQVFDDHITVAGCGLQEGLAGLKESRVDLVEHLVDEFCGGKHFPGRFYTIF